MFIAKTLVRANVDVVAIQEVTAGKGAGVQAVANIVSEMNRLRANSFDFIVSNPTQPKTPGVERYGFIWKKSSVVINRRKATLLVSMQDIVDREPYVVHADASCAAAPVEILSFHATPDSPSEGKFPRGEAKALARESFLLASSRVIVAGDFNARGLDIDQYFSEGGFTNALDVPTSLGMKITRAGYLRNNFDHFFTKGVIVRGARVIDFVGEMGAGNVDNEILKRARKISDHLPIFMTFE